MKTRILLVCVAIMTSMYGCATQNTESSQTPAEASAEPAAQAINNADKPSTPEPAPPPVKVAEKPPAKATEEPCDIKGKKIMLGGRPIGISIEMGYCPSNIKPEGSKFWIPADEVPAIGNIRVDDQCNITYCPTTAHYDHFNVSDGTHNLQVQVRWEDNQPIIY